MPTESQLRDSALRLRIPERIENGSLPVMVPEQIHVGSELKTCVSHAIGVLKDSFGADSLTRKGW